VKLFLLREHPIGPEIGIGFEREYTELIPSRQFGSLMSGEWIRFVPEKTEYVLTQQGFRAIELYRHGTRLGSKRTYRTKKRP